MSYKTHPEKLLQMQEIIENIVKAERYLLFLYENGFITESAQKKALDCIKQIKKRNRVFVTEKFRSPSWLQNDMYNLMRSRISAFKELVRERGIKL